MVHPEIRCEIPDCHVGETVRSAENDEDTDSNSKAEIAEEDEFGVLGLVERTVWIEVVDTSEESVDLALSATFMLTPVIVMTSDVAEKIHGPSKELLSERVEEGCNRSLLRQFVKFVDHFPDTAGIYFAGLGEKDHITLHVSSGLVMLAVGDLP